MLVTHGVHHLPSADKVIIMEGGKITHFGSFEEVRDAGAMFALASTAGEADTAHILGKDDGTAATVMDVEEEEELNWQIEQSSRLGAYTFYMQCTGVWRACGLFAFITLWSATTLFSVAYLSSKCLVYLREHATIYGPS